MVSRGDLAVGVGATPGVGAAAWVWLVAEATRARPALEALGDPFLYYENTFGGHANDADPELNARRWARHYVYLTQKLMD